MHAGRDMNSLSRERRKRNIVRMPWTFAFVRLSALKQLALGVSIKWQWANVLINFCFGWRWALMSMPTTCRETQSSERRKMKVAHQSRGDLHRAESELQGTPTVYMQFLPLSRQGKINSLINHKSHTQPWLGSEGERKLNFKLFTHALFFCFPLERKISKNYDTHSSVELCEFVRLP